jgi:hypothetical protein
MERGLAPRETLDEPQSTTRYGVLEFDRLIVYCVAMASVAASVLHISAAIDHARAGMPWFAGLFVVTAELQLLWAVVIPCRPSRRWLAVCLHCNYALVLFWALSRTSGLPVIPGAQAVEPLGFKDVTTVCLELMVVVGAGTLAIVPSGGRWPVLRVGRTAFVVVLTAVAVMTGLALTRPPAHTRGGGAHEARTELGARSLQPGHLVSGKATSAAR